MSEFEIKKGVKPKRSTGRGRPERWPYADMEVGDCIDAPIPEGANKLYVQTNALNAARMYRMFSGNKDFKVQTSTSDEPGFVRVWRIA